MLSKLRNDYLVENGFVEEFSIVGKDAYEQLTPEEKESAEAFGNYQYAIKTPKKVTSDEFDEILKIQMGKDISKIKKYAKIICGIVVSSFVLSIVAAIYTMISISAIL